MSTCGVCSGGAIRGNQHALKWLMGGEVYFTLRHTHDVERERSPPFLELTKGWHGESHSKIHDPLGFSYPPLQV